MEISDTAKQELNSFLETSLRSLTDGIKDVKAEMPKVAKEIVLFDGVIGSLVNFLQFSVGLAVCGAISYYVNKSYPDYWGFHILTAFVAMGMGMGVIDSLYSALKAKFAPRLFLLKYASDLIRPAPKE